MAQTTRVLSIDGGGIRGILPALILATVERQTGKRIYELFDVIAGASTGGILACGLAKPDPMTAAEMASVYIDDGPKIFACSPARAAMSTVRGSKYEATVLESILREKLGDAKLSDCLTDVLIPAYDLESREAYFFKSWRAQGLFTPVGETPADADFFLRDVSRATAAAPTYFEPVVIRNMTGKSFSLIDGSITASAPAMCAVASVKKLYPQTNRIVLLSLGTGSPSRPIPHQIARQWGALGWARPALECLMDGAADTVDCQLRESYTDDELIYVRINTRMGTGADCPADAIDDTSVVNIKRLIVRANAMAADAAADLARIWHLLVP
jgi:uncharacterized protein